MSRLTLTLKNNHQDFYEDDAYLIYTFLMKDLINFSLQFLPLSGQLRDILQMIKQDTRYKNWIFLFLDLIVFSLYRNISDSFIIWPRCHRWGPVASSCWGQSRASLASCPPSASWGWPTPAMWTRGRSPPSPPGLRATDTRPSRSTSSRIRSSGL